MVEFLKKLFGLSSYRYKVTIDGDMVFRSNSFVKASYTYELEVNFNNLFKLPHVYTICLLERCDDGCGWEYIKVREYRG